MAHLTGISCPVFGVSWNPPEPEITATRRLITYLEDRRVLYDPCEIEIPAHCVHSVIQIRDLLTQELMRSGQTTEFTASLRALRAACRKFLSRTLCNDREIIPFANHQGQLGLSRRTWSVAWSVWGSHRSVGCLSRP